MRLEFMKYFCACMVAIVAISHPAMSQETDSLAKVLYTQAQIEYANGEYNDALVHIKITEIAIEGATSKTLYLRIKILDQITNTDKTYLSDLQSALRTFFEITDKAKCPADKYQEMSDIQKARENQATGAASAPQKEPNAFNKEEEQKDYDLAIKAGTMDGYKVFLDKYTYTPHSSDIQSRYDDLVDELNKEVKKDRKRNRELRKDRIDRYFEDRYFNW